MTWEIFLGISALFAFCIAIITPIIKLSANITRLNCSIDSLIESLARSDKRIDAHAQKLDDHEHRITVLEEQHEERMDRFDHSV